ncbi:MAG: aldo/keto reductase [Treponema sp.]|jgi:predicted aldo/keto reductase-like oxidoreductase|nr:aldo/keto reductase [Treponema sp.]
MEYRKIGKTGISAGVIGLGCEHLAGKPYNEVADVVSAALDGGVNILDVFMPGKEVRQNIGRAVGKRRDRVLIQGHIGSTDIHEQNDVSRDLATCRKYFESYLDDMGTDYIDFGMFFFVDTPADFEAIFETELLGYAQDLKKRGIIRAIGASSHNSVVARRIVETGMVDLIMFSVNPVFDSTPAESDIYNLFEILEDETRARSFGFRPDPDRAALYRVCAEREVGITVMKTLCAGKLLSEDLSPFRMPMNVGQCIHYALTRPAVVSTLVGCQSRAEVMEALRYFDMSDAERDYSAVIEGWHRNFRGNCMYCNHCLPCPSAIDVASVHRYLDIAALRRVDIPPSVKQHYLRLTKHGSDCIACGSCEKRCPFGVPVIRNMKRAAELFGT